MVTPNWRQLDEVIARMSEDDKRLLIARVQRAMHGPAEEVRQEPEGQDEAEKAQRQKEAWAVLRERLASLDQGEPGVPADQVLADVRQRLGLSEK